MRRTEIGYPIRMAVQMSRVLPHGLRFEPTPKRVRADRRGTVVADTTNALLVWEPEQTVPKYAIPKSDIDWAAVPDGAARSVDDPDLADHVILDWDAFDRWREEEAEVVGHPRDPFHRVDTRTSSRHVEVTRDGVVLADSTRPTLVFETGLPVRYYLPREDVAMERLIPSERVTLCAYKGEAHYWSVDLGVRVERDLAWCYPEPLPDNHELQGLIAFFNEKTDIRVDGEFVERPHTQWS